MLTAAWPSPYDRPVIEWSADSERNRRVADRVLRALPRWFGLEGPRRVYVEEAAAYPTSIATVGGADVGFLTLRRRTEAAVEISAMGILPEHHRHGLGSALVEAAAVRAAREGARLIQVKTLGPSHPSEGYAATRKFYEAMGFLPLEETDAFWGPANPCLILVRTLERYREKPCQLPVDRASDRVVLGLHSSPERATASLPQAEVPKHRRRT
jgi:GNAT superfamily N-acetyltransferase